MTELTQIEYHNLRMEGSLFAFCQRCGKCEMAGGYCSNCTMAEYNLVPHVHDRVGPKLSACPFTRGNVSTDAPGMDFYRHVPGASTKRFPTPRAEVTEAQRVSIAANRGKRRSSQARRPE